MSPRRVRWAMVSAAVLGASLALLAFRPAPKQPADFGPVTLTQAEVVSTSEPLPSLATPIRADLPDGAGDRDAGDPPRGKSLRIRVHDENERPIEGAVLAVVEQSSDRLLFPTKTTTDSEGRVLIPLPPDAHSFRVVASAEGFSPAMVEVSDPPASEELTLLLHTGNVIRGKAQLPRGEAARNVRIVALSTSSAPDAPERGLVSTPSSWWVEGRARDDGSFRLEGAGQGEYVVRAAQDGWHTVRAARDRDSDFVEIVVRPVRLVRFIPIDSATGLPITLQGLGVEARGTSSDARGGAVVATTVVGPAGLFNTGAFAHEPFLIQTVFYDEQPPSGKVEVLLYWMTDKPVYMPTLAHLTAQTPAELLSPTSVVDRVRLKMVDGSGWCPGVRVSEDYSGPDARPSGETRWLVLEGTSVGGVLAARGILAQSKWTFAPVPCGRFTGRIHSGTALVSEAFTLETIPGQIAEAVARFPPPTGFRLQVADEDGPVKAEAAFYASLDRIGGEEKAARERITVGVLDPAGPPAVYGVPGPGAYRITVVGSGGSVANGDVEIRSGEVVPVQLRLTRPDGRAAHD